VVTGYEQEGERYWWVDRCPDEACQPVYVAALYQGSDRENFHYFWRCRPTGLGDVRILRVHNDARMASSNRRDTRWRPVAAGDVVAPGTFLQIGPHSEVHWRRDAPGGANGIIKTQGEGRTVRVEPTDLIPVAPEVVGPNDGAT
jgi:hypothetical protein